MDNIFKRFIVCLTLAAVIDNGKIFTNIQSYIKYQENHFFYMIKNINNHICFMEKYIHLNMNRIRKSYTFNELVIHFGSLNPSYEKFR